MKKAASSTVSVIITAYEAASTIAGAVQTALAETETVEVIVVDDASEDNTVEAAKRAGQGDARLKVVRCAINGGPAAARNRALAITTGDFIAVLDADDFILPGRFTRLLAISNADMIADNILFVDENSFPDDLPPAPPVSPRVIDIDLVGFVRANHSVRGKNRQEWGFLKPIIRRAFLESKNLRYDETMRLGEDYDLYVRMLQKKARFRVSTEIGYAARWRYNSLSSRHSTADLQALHAAALAHLSVGGMDDITRTALSVHAKELERRFLLRDFLDRRAEAGRIGALLSACRDPLTLAPIARGILSDKLGAYRPPPASRIGRLLIE